MAVSYIWSPRPEDVKAIIPQRLGGEPFGFDTVPTEGEVSLIIDRVAGRTASYVVEDITAQCAGLATYVVALDAAAVVERGLFPEQAVQPGSQYEQLRDEADRLRRELYFCVNGVWPVDEEEAGAESHPLPLASFPTPVPWGTIAPEVPDEAYVPLNTIMGGSPPPPRDISR
jgi:hypothetical protein